jgi:hypothetical protein
METDVQVGATEKLAHLDVSLPHKFDQLRLVFWRPCVRGDAKLKSRRQAV